MTAYTIRDMPEREQVGEHRPFFESWLRPWADSDFRKVYFAKFLNVLAFAVISNYILYYLTDMFPSYAILGVDFKTPQSATGVVGLAVSVFAVVGAVLAARDVYKRQAPGRLTSRRPLSGRRSRRSS